MDNTTIMALCILFRYLLFTYFSIYNVLLGDSVYARVLICLVLCSAASVVVENCELNKKSIEGEPVRYHHTTRQVVLRIFSKHETGCYLLSLFSFFLVPVIISSIIEFIYLLYRSLCRVGIFL